MVLNVDVNFIRKTNNTQKKESETSVLRTRPFKTPTFLFFYCTTSSNIVTSVRITFTTERRPQKSITFLYFSKTFT